MRYTVEPCGAGRFGIYLEPSGRLLAYHWDYALALALVSRLNRKES